MSAFATTSFGAQAGLLLYHLDAIQFADPVYYIHVIGQEPPLLRRALMARFVNLDIIELTAESKPEAMATIGREGDFDVWITGIRRVQTPERRHMNPLMRQYGFIKISPFFEWSDDDVVKFLRTFEIPHEDLPRNKIECGLHV